MTKAKLRISGMHCTSCSMLIDGDLEDTKGVISARTNYAKETLEVEFNEKEIKVEEIVEIIRKTGYQAQ